jgi:hypothetical protein
VLLKTVSLANANRAFQHKILELWQTDFTPSSTFDGNRLSVKELNY